MNKYSVDLFGRVFVRATVIVEAENEDDAKWLALNKSGCDIEWEYGDEDGERDTDEVTKL